MTADSDITDYTQGDSAELVFTVNDTGGNVIDLTGASAEWVLAPQRGATPDLSKTTSGGGAVITDAANGELTVNIDPADTDELEGTFHHELEITDSSGNVSTVTTGTFHITEDTT